MKLVSIIETMVDDINWVVDHRQLMTTRLPYMAPLGLLWLSGIVSSLVGVISTKGASTLDATATKFRLICSRIPILQPKYSS